MQEQDLNNPYAAPSARIEQQHQTNAHGLVLADRGTRLGAYIVDALVVGVWFAPIYWNALSNNDIGAGSILSMLIGFGLSIYNLVLLHRSGQTIAKRWMNIRIVRADGSRAGLGRIFALRMVVPGVISAIPVLGGIFTLADALCIFAQDRRTLHDRIADTIVVQA